MDKVVTFKYEPILLNPANDLKLAIEGYAIFPLLKEDDIKKLTDYYSNFQKEELNHFYSSTHSKNFSFRKNTSDFIKEIISPLLSSHFKNYKLLGGAFVVKPANGKGILPPHQDWNLVDETKQRSYNLWIPLIDVTVENGAVYVLPESHSKIPTYRGPKIPSLFKDIEKVVWENLMPLPMKAGEALFYDHALLHASPVNTTNKIRLGIVCGVINEHSDVQLYFETDNKISAYKADESFFMEKDPLNGPEGLIFKENREPSYTSLNAEQFTSLYLKKKLRKEKNWFQRIFGK